MNTVMQDADTGRPVRINWVDSGLHVDGWQQGDAIPTDAPTVETVGIWLGQNDNVVAIASTRGDGGAWLNVQVIWQPAIMRKVFLS